MTNKELTPQELAEAFIRHLDTWALPASEDGFNAVFVWEDLICEEPEKAWLVFLELLARRNDDDTLEQISYRLELLLANHWEAFHERVAALVHGHAELPRFLPDGALAKERFETKEVPDEQIVQAYLENHRHSASSRRIEEIIASDPERGLALALAIIHRGQLYEFGSFDLFSPLQDLLRQQGELVIDRIEQEAEGSVMLRRCLWQMKRHEEGRPPEYRIAEHVWRRAERAAGGTNDYNSELPAEARLNPMPEEDEALLSAWFGYEQTSWASSMVWEMTGNDPEHTWKIIKALVANAPDEATLGYIGAGPLEDLLSGYGEQFIERVEQQAAADVRFRRCLADVWQAGMSDELWQRVRRALGEQACE